MKTIEKNWATQIKELEDFFKKTILPQGPITLSKGIEIADPELFVRSHLLYVKANNGNRIFKVYLDRLQEFRNLLEEAKKKK